MPDTTPTGTPHTPPMAVSTEEAARLIGFAPQTLANWRKRGVGPHYVRSGRAHSSVVYMTSDLEAWLLEHRV